MRLDFEIDWSDFDKLEEQFGPVCVEESQLGLSDFLAQFERHMKQKRMSGNWRNPTRKGVATRTGALKADFRTWVNGDTLNSIEGHVSVGSGPASKYASIQEHGGTITAKGKMLRIPMQWPPGSGKYPALTNAGVDRFPNVRSAGLQLLFLVVFPSGKKALLPLKPKGAKVVAAYLGKETGTPTYSGAKLPKSKRLGLLRRMAKALGIRRRKFSPRARGSRGGQKKRTYKYTLYYKLVKSVKLRPRLGLNDTFKEFVATKSAKAMERIGRNIVKRLE